MTHFPDTPQSLFILRSGSAAKLGQRAEGRVHFELVTDGAQLLIRLIGNDGGGYFGRDAIPFSRIRAAVAELKEGQGFATKTLRDCFVASRSANNAGFLACVLRAEGLLTAAPASAHLHQVCGQWDDWEQACLELPGAAPSTEGPHLPMHAAVKTSKKDGRARRKAGLTDAEAQTTGENCNADPA